MEALERYRPTMATVLDWESEERLAEVLDWAEEAAQYVERVVLIPKVPYGVPKIPRRIAGRDIILGYSVPTKYGSTPLPLWSFAGWPVHLLGGSPRRQIECWSYLINIADIVSADMNYHMKMATHACQFWVPGNAYYAQNRYWPTIREADGKRWEGGDAPYEAFRRSCENIIAAWESLCGNCPYCGSSSIDPIKASLSRCLGCGKILVVTEVYSRVVGYIRPVQAWNLGKRQEWKERVTYSIGGGGDYHA